MKQPCTAGSYCPLGSSSTINITLCPPGSYNPNTGGESADACKHCPAGKYCLEGATTPSGDCPIGSYCLAKTVSDTAGTSCPAGTYNDYAGAKSVTECKICPMGYYCTGGSTSAVLCPLGTFSDQVKVGMEVDDGVSGSRYCTPCPEGHMCDSQPLFAPVPCGVGNHQALTS
jgi:hypothetical protein